MQYEDAVRYRREYESLRFRLPVEGPLTDEETARVEWLEYALFRMWGWCAPVVLIPRTWAIYLEEHAEESEDDSDSLTVIAPLGGPCRCCGALRSY